MHCGVEGPSCGVISEVLAVLKCVHSCRCVLRTREACNSVPSQAHEPRIHCMLFLLSEFVTLGLTRG